MRLVLKHRRLPTATPLVGVRTLRWTRRFQSMAAPGRSTCCRVPRGQSGFWYVFDGGWDVVRARTGCNPVVFSPAPSLSLGCSQVLLRLQVLGAVGTTVFVASVVTRVQA